MKPGKSVTISIAGLPGAGKSALIAALGTVAQTQERTLGFRIHDPDNRLDDARAGVPIDLQFEPLVDGLPRVDDGGTLTLIEQSENEKSHGSNAIVLVCDATRGRPIIDSLHATLSELRSARGLRTEVAGLPVIVALNQCDRLPATEAAELGAMIGNGLSEFSSPGSPAFGDLSVRVVATSCISEPRGVAEAFSAAIPAALEYRRRQIESRSRLNWTTLGAALVIAMLVCFGAGLVISRSSLFVSALALKVEDYRATEGIGAVARLQAPLQAKADMLAGFLADPQFSRLSASAQAFVRGRLLEIDAYRDFQRRLNSCSRPTDARNDDQLTVADRCLHVDAAPPAGFAADWSATDAVVLHKKRLADVAAIRAGIGKADEWYRQHVARAGQLLHMKGPSGTQLDWPEWNSSTKTFLAESTSPPFRPGDKLPQTESLPSDKAPTFAVPLSYPQVVQARADFEKSRGRLISLWNMAEALGCFPLLDRRGPLALTDSFTVDRASQTIGELRAADPNWADWSPARFPEAAAIALKPYLRNSWNRLIDAGRREIAHRVAPASGQSVVSPAQWRAVGEVLASSTELQPWRDLLAVVTRWLDPHAPDPLVSLVEFLRHEQFEIELRGLRLTLPDAAAGRDWKPEGPLTISIQRADAKVESVTFRPTDQGVRDAAHGETAYRFAVEGSGALVVRPGDSIWAEIRSRAANNDVMVLTWWANGVRTAAYQFDRFEWPPRMHRADQKPEAGELVPGITIQFSPDRAWPRLPDLLPALR